MDGEEREKLLRSSAVKRQVWEREDSNWGGWGRGNGVKGRWSLLDFLLLLFFDGNHSD